MKFRPLFYVGLVLLVAITACDVLVPPTPTPTPAPTETPTLIPTATHSPTPRASATPTREGALPPAIAFALNKTQGANSMKFDFESALTLVENGATRKIPGLALTGIESTLNREVKLSGTTTDTNELITYEIVVVGADAFIKGLSGVPGLDETQWYQLPEQMQAGVRRLPSARGLINSFSPEDVGKAQFQAAGNEIIDDENCSVWSAQNAAFAQILIGVTEGSDLKARVGEIDATEFKIYTCADGYIHRLTGSVQGHSAQNQANTATVTLRFEMTDFNKAFNIEPPANVKPFPTPSPEPTSASEPTAAPESTTQPEPTGAPESTAVP